MRFLLALLVALTIAACVTFDSANIVGPDDSGGGMQNAINRVEIFPSQFEVTNGSPMVATVRAYVGDNEVANFAFDAVIAPNQDVVTILSRGADTVTMKAENPGNTDLVVTATKSGARAVARITVKPASE